MAAQHALSSKWAGIVAALLLCFQLTTTSHAQNASGSISGTLTDSAGAVLRGAQVFISATGMIVFTDQGGHFLFSGLQPGDYTISVSYIGFQELTKTITVNPGASTSVSLQLEIASQKQSVLVTAGSASAEVEA